MTTPEAITREPNPEAVFCRRHRQEFPEYLSLGEIRAEMDLVEPQLIDAIAELKIRMDGMVTGKNELPFSTFVEQYWINEARIKEQAATVNPGLEGFEEMVAWVFRPMVLSTESIRYAHIRDREPGIETSIVSLIAERCRLVRQAAFFKRDLGESSAPARQERNIANARAIASQYTDRIPKFENYIEDVYSLLVPESVALQHRFLRTTSPAAYRHRVWGISALLMERQDERILGLPNELAVREFVRQKIA